MLKVAFSVSEEKVQLKALMSELQIMIHLGQHVNILNLIGAVTKHIDQGWCKTVYLMNPIT